MFCKCLNVICLVVFVFCVLAGVGFAGDLEAEFVDPPDSARPGVYWYFMDGNLSREGMTADLESMKEVGLGNLVYLEVNVRVPRGPVDFMSDQWQDLFAHAVHEAERLGIDITLGTGPGWTGSGGPWIKPEQAMPKGLEPFYEARFCKSKILKEIFSYKPFSDSLLVIFARSFQPSIRFSVL